MGLKKGRLTTDIGIDLGTASVLVYVRDRGIVLYEPSIVAIDKSRGQVLRIGKEAQPMIGRTSGSVVTVRPLKDGVIHQYDVTMKMLHHFIRRACGNILLRPRVMICVPTGITEVEERAVIDAATQAGARETRLIEEPLAAAIGAGLNIYEPQGHMVVDIGGGTTDIAVISYGGIVVSESIKVAGDKFDEAIMSYVRKNYQVLIGEQTAEMIKIKIGSVFDNREVHTAQVKGRCLVNGLPKTITFGSNETLDALLDPMTAILDAICLVMEKTPPELLGDIYKNGIVLTGGGSQLRGLDRLIEQTTGIRTYVAKDPVLCVALGTGKSLESLDDGSYVKNFFRHLKEET